MRITRYRFARPEQLMPILELKPAAIRSTELMPITGNDAGRTTDSPLESGKTGSMGE
jgi:hypothetical protein